VELLGPHVLLDEVAQAAGTIAHEVLTGLGLRAKRIYLGGEE
jgi:alanine racemase